MSNKTPVTYKTPKNPSPHGYKFNGDMLPVSSNYPEFRSNKHVSETSQILIDCLFRQEKRLEKIKLLHHLTAHISEIEAKVKQLELQEQASTARESLIKEFHTERSSSQALGEGVPASNLFSNPAQGFGSRVHVRSRGAPKFPRVHILSREASIEEELAVSESKVTQLSTYLEELAGENRKLKDALAAQDSSWESLEGKAASLEEEL